MDKAWRIWIRLGLLERLWLLWWPPAAVATLAAFFGFYRQPLIGLLTGYLVAGMGLLLVSLGRKVVKATINSWGVLGIISIWLLHAVQIFVPETGFDAVWYHLPVMRAVSQAGGLIYLPNLYQTLNPLWSDLVFGLGYVALGDLGAKIIAYLFGLSLAAAVFGFAQQWLSRTSALWLVAVVSVFQVVAWQCSSFYVDLAKAFWEILWLWGLVRALNSKQPTRPLALANLAFCASLSTKLFSLLLLPMAVLATCWVSHSRKLSWRSTIVSLVLLILPALPYYVFAGQQTGHPFYVMSLVGTDLPTLTGSTTSVQYVISRTLQLPLSLASWLVARDYVFPMIVLLIPWAINGWRSISKTQNRPVLIGLTIFGVFQWLIWWYLPPWSTRYALSGFIVLALLIIWGWQQNVRAPNWTKYILLAGILLQLLPRLWVTSRSLPYLLGQQTKRQYLEQFLDGSIDAKLTSWHADVWPPSPF